MSGIYRTENGRREVMALYDDILQRWPVPAVTRTIDTRHGDTFVISSGEDSRPPLILLHGAGSNATSWVGEVEAYTGSFTVHAVDIPGEPGRSAENRLPLAGPAYADWLADVLDGLGLSRVFMVGLSQGGWTALRFATLHPERVERLVLLASGGIAPTRLSFVLRAMCLSILGHAGARRLNRLVVGGQELDEFAVRAMDLIMTRFRPRIEKEYLFTANELGALNMPVLLIEGARDVIHSARASAERLGRFAPQVRTQVIPERGHCLVDVCGITIPFLAGVPAETAGAIS